MALHMLADIQGNPIREEEFEKEPGYASFAGSPFRSFSLRLLPFISHYLSFFPHTCFCHGPFDASARCTFLNYCVCREEKEEERMKLLNNNTLS